MKQTKLNRQVGVLTIRLLLGFILLMQGYGKVFDIGVDELYEFFFKGYTSVLPETIVKATAYYTSYVELLAGALLIVGFKRNIALYAMGSVLVIVTFGHGIMEPIWDLSHVMYRAILLIALLLLPIDWDVFSIDHVLKKKSGDLKEGSVVDS
jgi:uncharacterized membrane protein YphA (DoxX/SURF4 family)